MCLLHSTYGPHLHGHPIPPLWHSAYIVQHHRRQHQCQSYFYSGQNWTTSLENNFDYRGTHQYCTDPSATAIFTFTGISIFYINPILYILSYQASVFIICHLFLQPVAELYGIAQQFFSPHLGPWMTPHFLTFCHATPFCISGSQGLYSSSTILSWIFSQRNMWYPWDQKEFSVPDTPLSYHSWSMLLYNPNTHKCGRHRKLISTDINFIKSLVLEHPTIYLDEIQEQLLTQRGAQISISTLMRTLGHLHRSNKDVSGCALEQNIEQHAIFMNWMADLVENPNMLMFGDEAAMNECTSARRQGWSLWGTRCVQRKRFVCGQLYSILPILTLDGIITYDIIEGSVISDRFLQF